jgi:hypothetical protein
MFFILTEVSLIVNKIMRIHSRLCLTNSFVTRVARRGEGKASGHKSLEAYYQYVEDDLRTGNAAIADASPSAVGAICQTEPNIKKYLRYEPAASCTCGFREKDRITGSTSMITTMNAVNRSLPVPFSRSLQPGIINR